MELHPPVHFEPQRRQERKVRRPENHRNTESQRRNTEGPTKRKAPAACALEERSPRHLSSSVAESTAPSYPTGERAGRTDAPRGRRPVGSMAATDARVRSRPASHRQAIVRSPAVPPSICHRFFASFASLRFILSVRAASVFLCALCASVVHPARQPRMFTSFSAKSSASRR
jgi:hypothetical protein